MAQELTPEAFRKMVLENLPKPRLSGKPNEDLVRAGMQVAFANHFPKALAEALSQGDSLITQTQIDKLGFDMYNISHGTEVGQFIEDAFIGSKPNSNPMADFNFGQIMHDIDSTIGRIGSDVAVQNVQEIKQEMNKLFNNQYYNDISEYYKTSTSGKGAEIKSYKAEGGQAFIAGDFTIGDVDEKGVIFRAIMKLYEKMSTLLLYSIKASYTSEAEGFHRKKEFVIESANIFTELLEDKIVSGFLKKQIYVKPLNINDKSLSAKELGDTVLLASRKYQVGFDFSKMDKTLNTLAKQAGYFYRYKISLWGDNDSRREFFAQVYSMIPENANIRISGRRKK